MWGAPLTKLNNWPRMVQLAWLLYDENQNLVSEANYIIKPEGFIIPADASNVHGITTKKALESGVLLGAVLREFSELILKSEIIIAHNLDFDDKIVGAEFLRLGVESALFDKPRFCTMKKTAELCQIPGPYGYKWPKLSELHYHLFNKDFTDAHDAAVDVKACAKCFFELMRLGFKVDKG
ncbi:DNA polymerase III PolC-type [ANME-1 cluster archaeon GoMg2]|nr:DNA polymerase III PolC-type [ANME-1 cluster archaeon GoMg2]